jgi:hypothetical protein
MGANEGRTRVRCGRVWHRCCSGWLDLRGGLFVGAEPASETRVAVRLSTLFALGFFGIGYFDLRRITNEVTRPRDDIFTLLRHPNDFI